MADAIGTNWEPKILGTQSHAHGIIEMGSDLEPAKNKQLQRDSQPMCKHAGGLQ